MMDAYDPAAMKSMWRADLAAYFATAVAGVEVAWAGGRLICWGEGGHDAVYVAPSGDLVLLYRGIEPRDVISQGAGGKYLACLWACQYGMNPFNGEFNGYAYGGIPPKI